jgi:hypothetical protein
MSSNFNPTGQDTDARRACASVLLKKALQEAGIEEGNETNRFPPLLGGTNEYWQEVNGDVELVFDSVRLDCGSLHARFRLLTLAMTVAYRETPDEAVKTIVDVINVLKIQMSLILPDLSNSLVINGYEQLKGMGRPPEARALIEKPFLFPRSVIDLQISKAKKRLRGVRHGGNRRTPLAWQDNGTLTQYAQRVDDRLPLVRRIKDMYEDCLGGDGWTEDLQQDSTFQKLSQGVPTEIIHYANRRVASNEIPAREREPLSIACEIAQQELGLPKQDVETLRSYYTAGRSQITQQRRSKRKQ